MLTLIIPTKTSPGVSKVVKEAGSLPIEIKVVVVGYQVSDSIKNSILDAGGVFWDEPRKGKGVAVVNALRKVTSEYVMVIDADGTYPVSTIPKLLGELQRGADAVIGYRYWKSKGSMTFLHRLGNFGLSLLASSLYGYWIKDVCTGMWGFRTEAVKKFSLTSQGLTLEAEFFINVRKSHCKLAQVPISYIPRTGGKAKATVSEGFKIGWLLVRRRFA